MPAHALVCCPAASSSQRVGAGAASRLAVMAGGTHSAALAAACIVRWIHRHVTWQYNFRLHRSSRTQLWAPSTAAGLLRTLCPHIWPLTSSPTPPAWLPSSLL